MSCTCVFFICAHIIFQQLVSLHVFSFRMGLTGDSPETNTYKYEQQGEEEGSQTEAQAPILLPTISKKKKKNRRRYFTFDALLFLLYFYHRLFLTAGRELLSHHFVGMCSKAGVCPPLCLSCLSDD